MNETHPLELNTLPQARARELVATGAPVYLLVNPVEYHGPHLPLYNDYLLSLASSRDLHQRLLARRPERDWPFIVGAPLHMGCDPVPGHGSVPFSYSEVRNAVLQACKGLEALGVKRVIINTFHGSPLHARAIQAGVNYLTRRGIQAIAPFNIVLQEMLAYKPGGFARALAPIADNAMRAFVAQNLYKDFHGGFFETSIVLHYNPQTVDPAYRALPPCPEIRPDALFHRLAAWAERTGRTRFAAECRFAAYGMGWLRLDPLPGYTGWPHLASAESGRAFVEDIMARYVPAVEAVFDQQAPAPLPIMGWVHTLSLGGRIQAH